MIRFSKSKNKCAFPILEKASGDDQDRVTELELLLKLLQYFSGHDFELRLYGGFSNDDSAEDDSGLETMDVNLICLGHILPLIDESVLAVSEVAIVSPSDFLNILSECRPNSGFRLRIYWLRK